MGRTTIAEVQSVARVLLTEGKASVHFLPGNGRDGQIMGLVVAKAWQWRLAGERLFMVLDQMLKLLRTDDKRRRIMARMGGNRQPRGIMGGKGNVW